MAANVATAGQRRNQEQRRRQRVEEAVKFCSDVLTDSWQDAVAERAADYVSQRTLRRLVRRRFSRECKALARLAAAVLEGKRRSHELVGRSVAWLVTRIRGSEVTAAFARELASKLPLPTDVKFVAVARGLQVTGVLLCVFDGRDLARCACFVDLAVSESKTRVKAILVAALDDWVGLAEFAPRHEPRGNA